MVEQVATNSAPDAGNASAGGSEGNQAAGQVVTVNFPHDNLNGLSAMGVDVNDRNGLITLMKLGARARGGGWDRVMDEGDRQHYSGHKFLGEVAGRDKWDFTTQSQAAGQEAEAEAEAAIRAARASEGQGGAAARPPRTEGGRLYQEFVRQNGVPQSAEDWAEFQFFMQQKNNEALAKAQTAKDADAAKKADRQRRISQTMKEQDDGVAEAIKAIGHTAAEAEVDWLGGKRKVDVYGETLAGGILRIASKLQQDSFHPDTPREQIEAAMDEGVPARFIQMAAALLKPHLTAQQAKAVDKKLNQLANQPGATLPAGAGGTPQKNSQDMSKEERVAEFNRRAAAKGLVTR